METIEGERFWLPELARPTGGRIPPRHYLRCVFEGPAVLLAWGAEYVGTMTIPPIPGYESITKFHPEAFFWEQGGDDAGAWTMGAISAEGSRFEDCVFDGIGWGGSTQQKQWLADSISLGRWAEEMRE